MQGGRGVKLDKAETALAKAGILTSGEQPLAYVKCNNFRPMVDHVLVTSARIIGFAEGEKRAKFVAVRDDQTRVTPEAAKSTLSVQSGGEQVTFKQIHADDFALLTQVLSQSSDTAMASELATQRDMAAIPFAEDGPLAALKPKDRKRMAEALEPGEEVVVAAQGENGALVATTRRILIGKGGITTGAFFNKQVNSWGLKQVSGVMARKTLTVNALVIQASGMPDITGFGRFDKGPESVWEATNALVLAEDANTVAAQIRTLIADAHATPATAAAAPAAATPGMDDVAAQVRQLAALRDEGLLTDDEFAAKKRQLLGL